MQTLGLLEAAALLKMSAEGLRRLAKAGKVPGRKAGKRWLFVDTHLVHWLEGAYADQEQAARHEEISCRSTNAKIHPIGGSGYNSPATRQCRHRLGLKTG